ncbi:SRPBCC family protein [Sediminibacterium ginsengisoli]|uniref:Polyketide cyclase / dehydrase and lipid transport n=1 Tax=Sediminibacterium ginsengisoli TaxID=413434 RepID=A0A1T4L6Y4_9BACT|nr:SRPBCC family protein [Sediminibacterium ginsengisoli]SJZ50482.1 Polyketide cyclase / dehydrase and lipid transport [Sediminibacterium ginsengisoli]
MKILKKIIIAILLLLVLVLVIALFMPKEYTMERDITINRPQAQVYDYARMIKNQDYYNVWVMMDPGMKKTYTGTDGTVGFLYAWDSEKKAGKGEQQITKLEQNNLVAYELRFIKPFEGKAECNVRLQQTDTSTTNVNWSFHSSMAYPMNIMLPFVKGMMGKNMEETLSNMKREIEKK